MMRLLAESVLTHFITMSFVSIWLSFNLELPIYELSLTQQEGGGAKPSVLNSMKVQI